MLGNAGCTWDDIVDADLDRHVACCHLRPMARGAIPVTNATIFFFVQLAVGLGILYSIGTDVLYSSVPFVSLGVAYPLVKRVTYYPGVELGLAVTVGWLCCSWSELLGIGVGRHEQRNSTWLSVHLLRPLANRPRQHLRTSRRP
jgi:4-hydroxybenzoate polyprenyltransferase